MTSIFKLCSRKKGKAKQENNFQNTNQTAPNETYLLMSRSPAPLRLSCQPDLLQYIPENRTTRSLQNQTISLQNSPKIHRLRQKKIIKILLLLRFVIHKNGSPERSASDLLHDLVLIHSRLHESGSTTNQQDQCQTRKTNPISTSHHLPLKLQKSHHFPSQITLNASQMSSFQIRVWSPKQQKRQSLSPLLRLSKTKRFSKNK